MPTVVMGSDSGNLTLKRMDLTRMLFRIPIPVNQIDNPCMLAYIVTDMVQ